MQSFSIASSSLTTTVGIAPVTGYPAAAEPTVAALVQQEPPAAAVTRTDPISVATAVVSNLFAGFLNPLAASDIPGAPPDTPLSWSLLAFVRREFETVFAPRSVSDTAVNVQTTSQALIADAQASDLQAQAVENSLTYTAPPTLIDQLTLFGLHLVVDVSELFGINFAGLVGGLIASEDPPFFLTFGLNAQKTDVEVSPGVVWKAWEFMPPNPTGKTVIAIHGGGFIFQPNIMHWIDYTQMARETGATVLVPLYPLATTEAGSAINVNPQMANYISQVIDEHGAQNVSIYADSAGYTFAFGAVRELILRGDTVPASMVLLSGSAANSLNPDARAINDPFFDIDNLDFWTTGNHVYDGMIEKDPRVSPLYMETDVLRALPPTTIYVGTEEIVLPDNLLLYQRAVDVGAPISMVVGQGQIHDWALGGLPTNSAAPVVRRDIYRQLGLRSAMSSHSAMSSNVEPGPPTTAQPGTRTVLP